MLTSKRALGPSASPATTVDHGDGTYGVRFTAGAVGEYRVEVDNVKIKGSPHLINFTEPTAAQKKPWLQWGALQSMGSMKVMRLRVTRRLNAQIVKGMVRLCRADRRSDTDHERAPTQRR